MKAISLVTASITILLLLSTLICGLWIKSHNLTNDIQSLVFHMKVGIASVIFGSASAILLVIQVMKH